MKRQRPTFNAKRFLGQLQNLLEFKQVKDYFVHALKAAKRQRLGEAAENK